LLTAFLVTLDHMDMNEMNSPSSAPIGLTPRKTLLPLVLAGLLSGGAALAQTEPMQPKLQEPMQAPQTAPLQSTVDASRQPADPATAAAARKAAEPADGSQPAAAASGEPAPLNSLTNVGSDYRIGSNDLLEFEVFGVPDMRRTVRVNSSGAVSLPLIGPVVLAGLTAQDAEVLIAQRYSENFLQNPQVSLFIKEFTTQRITIEGAVTKPGIYPVVGSLTLLRALALAGGGAQYANLNEIMMFRNTNGRPSDPKVYDLDKIRAGEMPDPIVESDDVIVVKRDPKRTALRDSLFRDIIDTLNPFR
jgi:polysaccharide biosynthesis/export protein